MKEPIAAIVPEEQFLFYVAEPEGDGLRDLTGATGKAELETLGGAVLLTGTNESGGVEFGAFEVAGESYNVKVQFSGAETSRLRCDKRANLGLRLELPDGTVIHSLISELIKIEQPIAR